MRSDYSVNWKIYKHKSPKSEKILTYVSEMNTSFCIIILKKWTGDRNNVYALE